jgi:cytochrome c oxidase subunit 3
MTVLETPPSENELEKARRRGGGDGGRRGGDGGRGPGGGGNGGDDEGRAEVARLVVIAMCIGLAPILMLFLAFISAYVVRQGLGTDWLALDLPGLVWVNTVVLLASSVTLEIGRRAAVRGEGSDRWLRATLGLGIVFVLGQLVAWLELEARGIGMGTSASSAFFYLLTGAHALHVAGGILGLGAAAFWPERAFRNLNRAVAVKVASIYWHFMALIWLGVLALLVFWG